MTTSTTSKPNWKIALGLPSSVFLSCFLISFSAKFKLSNELLLNGILTGLLITALLVYFLAIRRSNVSNLTVTIVFIAGLLMAILIIPALSNPILQIIKTWLLPFTDIFVVFMICKKFYTANKNAEADNWNGVDFLMHCRSVMFQVLGNEKMASIVWSKISIIYYAFFARRVKSIDYKTKFTSYKENGLTTVLGAILFILLIGTIGSAFSFKFIEHHNCMGINRIKFLQLRSIICSYHTVKSKTNYYRINRFWSSSWTCRRRIYSIP